MVVFNNGCIKIIPKLFSGRKQYWLWGKGIFKIIFTQQENLAAMNLKNLICEAVPSLTIWNYMTQIYQVRWFTMKIYFPQAGIMTLSQSFSAVSPSGKYMFSPVAMTEIKIMAFKNNKMHKDIKIWLSYYWYFDFTGLYRKVSTTSFVEILISTLMKWKRYNAYYGVFSPNGKISLLLSRYEKGPINKCSGDGLFSLIENCCVQTAVPIQTEFQDLKLHVLSGQQIFYI